MIENYLNEVLMQGTRASLDVCLSYQLEKIETS